MLSQAGTGYSFNTKRSRLREKLTLLHYDPIGKIQINHSTINSDALKACCPFQTDAERLLAVFVAPLTLKHSVSKYTLSVYSGASDSPRCRDTPGPIQAQSLRSWYLVSVLEGREQKEKRKNDVLLSALRDTASRVLRYTIKLGRGRFHLYLLFK